MNILVGSGWVDLVREIRKPARSKVVGRRYMKFALMIRGMIPRPFNRCEDQFAAAEIRPIGVVNDSKRSLKHGYTRASHRGDEACKPRGRPFEPDHSGNPNGRPKGSRNKTTVLEELLDDEGEALVRKVIDKAQDGDIAALRLCIDRLVPRPRGRLVSFELPTIETAKDVATASAAILAACANGELSPEEAAVLMGLIEAHVRILGATEVEARLAALEAAAESTPKASSS
jgi:Family of unknown function (DUF5681)